MNTIPTFSSIGDVIKMRYEKQTLLSRKIDSFEKEKILIESDIAFLLRCEKLFQHNLDFSKILVAESIIHVTGNPYRISSDISLKIPLDNNTGCLADIVIMDIINDFCYLREYYFINIELNNEYTLTYRYYDDMYQPTTANITDSVAMLDTKGLFSDYHRECCVYYLMNYELILSLGLHLK